MGIVSDLVIMVAAALIGGALAHFLKQPLLLGYIIAGIFVGPYTAGPTVVEVRDIELLAEIGVGLLLFTVGLEFSFSELRRLKRITLLIAPLQVFLCTGFGILIFLLFGFGVTEAVWIGAATALSSTMVISKVIGARRDLPEPGTRAMLGVLISQDVLVVPLMILLPVVGGGAFSWSELLLACSKALGFLIALYFLGTRLFPLILRKVASSRSQELFFLTTLTIALGTGFVAHHFGLSFALGAFIAGMLLSDTDFSHQALADVSGLKDLFGMVFFVSVGMLINPVELVNHGASLLGVILLVLALKSVVIYTLFKIFSYPSGLTALVACGLAQVGEFAFVIANEGVSLGVLSPEVRSFTIGVAVVSMIVTPQLIRLGVWINAKTLTAAIKEIPDPQEAVPLQGMTLIVGGGSVAEMVARSLQNIGERCTIIERDIDRLHLLRSKGLTVLFGDARNIDKLAAQEIRAASVILVTSTEDGLNQSVIDSIRCIREDVPIVVRVQDIDVQTTITAPQVVSFIQPQVESALEMVRESLLHLGRPPLEAASVVSALRPTIYSIRCSNEERAQATLQRQKISRALELRWHEVTPGSRLVGVRLKESNLRELYGVTIIAYIRNGEVNTAPSPDTVFMEGDSLALLGGTEQVASFGEDSRSIQG
jgi:CPA2 family monovalent cation:H+ antiporter-2